MPDPTWSDKLRHRHADGTDHAHSGSKGFEIGGQVIPDRLGDGPHEHSTLSLTGAAPGPKSGPVVWTERSSGQRKLMSEVTAGQWVRLCDDDPWYEVLNPRPAAEGVGTLFDYFDAGPPQLMRNTWAGSRVMVEVAPDPAVAARDELARLEARFDAAGGRGVDLAERIDDLRARTTRGSWRTMPDDGTVHMVGGE
jgi:hypothetical protein